MFMTHLRAGGAIVLAVLALSACASSGTVATSPTPSPSAPTASPAPTATRPPTAPVSKPGPTTPDLATLTAAAKAYFEAENQAILTRHTTAFRRTFTDGCRICAADAADLDAYTRLGQTLHGGKHRLSSPSLFKAEPGWGILIMSYHQDPSTLMDGSGKTVKVFESGDVPRIYLQFKLIKQRWIVVGSVVG